LAHGFECLAVLHYKLADLYGVHARTVIHVCLPSVCISGAFYQGAVENGGWLRLPVAVTGVVWRSLVG
jgi:hypothetical protein